MNEPYLALHVKNDVLYFTKKLPKEDKPRDILEVDVKEIISNEFNDAARKLGGTVLGILGLWHKDVFGDWAVVPGAEDGEKQDENDFEIAMQLIAKSVLTKTKAYVGAIELLLRQQAIKTESAQKFFDESWPSIRARLESYS